MIAAIGLASHGRGVYAWGPADALMKERSTTEQARALKRWRRAPARSSLSGLNGGGLHGDERAAFPSPTRLRQLEDRLEAFETRLSSAERQRDPLVGGRATPWWFWLLFLLGLAVTWRALEALR